MFLMLLKSKEPLGYYPVRVFRNLNSSLCRSDDMFFVCELWIYLLTAKLWDKMSFLPLTTYSHRVITTLTASLGS